MIWRLNYVYAVEVAVSRPNEHCHSGLLHARGRKREDFEKVLFTICSWSKSDSTPGHQ